MTFLAALRCDRIEAPCVLDQPINGESFLAWVEQFLVPTLSPEMSSSSTTSAVKRPAIRQAIRAAGTKLLFLPPYSPDLNPLEQMSAKLKHPLRAAAERTAKATWKRIGSFLDVFSPTECSSYLVNAGSASS